MPFVFPFPILLGEATKLEIVSRKEQGRCDCAQLSSRLKHKVVIERGSGRYGKGLVAQRNADGEWGTPLFIEIGGGSFRLQLGVEAI